MIWLLLGLGLLILFFLLLGAAPASKPKPRRRRDHGGSGVLWMDEAPPVRPDDSGFSLSDDFALHDSDADDELRFRPGGGDFGGGGASGSWGDDSDDSDGGD